MPERPEILADEGSLCEVMQFTVNGSRYGITVDMVREILVSEEVTPMPLVHPAVEGVYRPRDTVITVVDLPYYLSGRPVEKHPKDLFIVTNFGGRNIAFRVHTVVGIFRIDPNMIQKPDPAVSSGAAAITKGIVKSDGNLITLLDLAGLGEKLVPSEEELTIVMPSEF
ncbi:MAG: purine-binding chemotaxis protein CheW [Firmicutes bacterium]|nr:purine-binding chemotaxis protein CheW [Bacillota bacterium]